jgi:hypothetical protein
MPVPEKSDRCAPGEASPDVPAFARKGRPSKRGRKTGRAPAQKSLMQAPQRSLAGGRR